MHYTRVKDGKKEKRKSKEISALWFSFTQDTSNLCRCIQNLKTLDLLGAEKSKTKNFIGENKKMTNTGNDKHEDGDSLLHNTRSHTQCLYKISKSYMQYFLRNP